MIPIDNGFSEVLGIVADATAAAERLTRALGYRVVHYGEATPTTLAMLGLPLATEAREAVVAHPDSSRGAIRLLSLTAKPAPLMRDGAQPWDCGGIFDINIRALDDIEQLHRGMGREGFRAFAPITDWQFGDMAVREIVEIDADGLCIALMQRVSPPLAEYETIGGNASWVFNSTQVVADFASARSLFVDHLGWKPVQETEGFAGNAGGVNCMGFPRDLAPQIPMRIGIYQAQGLMQGSVEIISYGCDGHDFSAGQPPQRGWAALRFAVHDLGEFKRATLAAGCTAAFEGEVDWLPYGQAHAFAVITPWGARLEAFRLI